MWAGVAAGAVATAVLLTTGKPMGALLMAGFAAPVVASLFLMDRVPPLVDLALVLAALLNAAGYVWDLYDRWPPFDAIVHGYTIFALTLVLALLAYGRTLSGETGLPDHRVQLVLVISSFGIAVGALWEIAEWAYDLVAPGDVILGKADTVYDLILDTGGALAAGALALWILPHVRRPARPRAGRAG